MMDFNRSDLQRMLLDSAERYIDERFTLEHRRDLRKTADGLDHEAWQVFAELGWLAILVPEDMGGLSGSITDASVLAEVLGKKCVTEPFISSAIIAPTILASSSGVPEGLMDELVAGNARFALAHDEPNERYAYDQPRNCTVEKSGDGLTLTGQKMMVPDGPSATHLIVTAQSEQGLALVLVPADAALITLDAYALYDNSRAADIRFDGTAVPASAVLAEGENARKLLSLALDRARVIGQAQAIGSMEEELEICSAYLKEREQFGQPIGKFQALQHIMADMFVEAHQSRSACYHALSLLDGSHDESDRKHAVSLAGIRIAEAGQFVSRQAIQLHGGYGVTDEYEVSHHYRRQFVLEKMLGDMDYLTRRLSEAG
ncbi:MAG: acyl-CoA dehydrogenase family protein [Sphingomonadaceae bacterium]